MERKLVKFLREYTLTPCHSSRHSSRLLKKVRPGCKYLKPRKYNEIRVIYLLSGRAVSCPFPRSIFMIKVFARTRPCTYTPLCIGDRAPEFININPKLVSVTRETTYGGC